jgi:hypothetical protein
MRNLIQRALDKCGYECEPSVDNLRECFIDYVSCGVFGNLTVEEAEEEIEDGVITTEQMCYNLLKI